jgi:hypothetical protein
VKAAALALCLALPVYADDAPRVLCLEPDQRVVLAKRLVDLEARNASLEQSVREAPSPALVVVLVVGAAVAGVAAGYGVSRVLR